MKSVLSMSGALLAAAAAAAAAGSCFGATLHVPADFPSIQDGMDASADGDTVLVSPGTYFEQIDFTGHEITVESTDGPETTTIDATFLGPAVTFTGSTRNATLRGFTVTRGKGNIYAGGVDISEGSASIIGNIITENLGEGSGNGISLINSDALIMGNQITDNANDHEVSGGGGGGGIAVFGSRCGECPAEIRDNFISGNTVDAFLWGGGIFVNGGAVVIVGNTIDGNNAPYAGAGIALINGGDAQIENNLIVDNVVQSGQGGGVYWLTPDDSRGPFLIGNTLVNNHALQGSGVFADGFDVSARIINNVIVGAQGTTGVECGDFNNMFSPIVMNNDVYVPDGTAYAGLCADSGGVDGNISEAPLFNAADDYQLQPTSPGIDAGANEFVTQSTDILGQPRIVDSNGDGIATVDMGAYELVPDEIFNDGFDP